MTTNAPFMTEHRKMQKQAEVVDALLSFVRSLKDNGWTVHSVDQYGEIQETLTMTDEYVYQWLGIGTKALEREKQEAVNWVLSGGY